MLKAPLQVVVVAHPKCVAGQRLAQDVYGWLTRNPARPTSRGLGIPVRFVTGAASGGGPAPIDLDVAERTVVVALVDDELLLDASWHPAVAEVAKKTSIPGGRHRLLPVSLSANAFRLPGVGANQYVRLHDAPEGERRDALRLELLSALCRHLLDRRQAGEAAGVAKAPVRVFVSHAKRDGLQIAEALVKEIDKLGLGRFFDASDIAPGHCFDREIEGYIEDSAVVVVATDAFGGRPWCQREVLAAKRRSRPLVIVDAMREGEARRFPYIGNAPVLHWDQSAPDGRASARRVVTALLEETLRDRVACLELERLASLGLVDGRAVRVSRPPELLTLRPSASGPAMIVHPDPPLGDHEIAVLRERDPDLVVTTPMTLAAGSHALPDLRGRVVGVSISVPPADHLAARGLAKVHVDDAWVEFGRWLLACSATLAFGGDLREGGFTEALFDLFRTRDDEGKKSPPLQSYLSWPIHLSLKTETEAAWLGLVKFHRVEQAPDAGLPADVAVKPDESHAAKFAWVRSLLQMRREMTAASHARLVVGGQIVGLGPYPGVAEEARQAIQAGLPTYVLGGFGGCAGEIAQLLAGESAPALTREFQCRDRVREEFVAFHDARVPAAERVDYDALRRVFTDAGWTGLRNGLSVDDNVRLARSTDIPEMIALVLRGLRATLGAPPQ